MAALKEEIVGLKNSRYQEELRTRLYRLKKKEKAQGKKDIQGEVTRSLTKDGGGYQKFEGIAGVNISKECKGRARILF